MALYGIGLSVVSDDMAMGGTAAFALVNGSPVDVAHVIRVLINELAVFHGVCVTHVMISVRFAARAGVVREVVLQEGSGYVHGNSFDDEVICGFVVPQMSIAHVEVAVGKLVRDGVHHVHFSLSFRGLLIVAEEVD